MLTLRLIPRSGKSRCNSTINHRTNPSHYSNNGFWRVGLPRIAAFAVSAMLMSACATHGSSDHGCDSTYAHCVPCHQPADLGRAA
ncbi:hypothetical protein ABIC51_006820 [Burkholderia sp. 572]